MGVEKKIRCKYRSNSVRICKIPCEKCIFRNGAYKGINKAVELFLRSLYNPLIANEIFNHIRETEFVYNNDTMRRIKRKICPNMNCIICSLNDICPEFLRAIEGDFEKLEEIKKLQRQKQRGEIKLCLFCLNENNLVEVITHIGKIYLCKKCLNNFLLKEFKICKKCKKAFPKEEMVLIQDKSYYCKGCHISLSSCVNCKKKILNQKFLCPYCNSPTFIERKYIFNERELLKKLTLHKRKVSIKITMKINNFSYFSNILNSLFSSKTKEKEFYLIVKKKKEEVAIISKPASSISKVHNVFQKLEKFMPLCNLKKIEILFYEDKNTFLNLEEYINKNKIYLEIINRGRIKTKEFIKFKYKTIYISLATRNLNQAIEVGKALQKEV